MIGWVMYGWVKAANCEYNAISSDSPTYIQGSKSEIVKTARLRYCFLYGLRLCICKVESLDYGVTFIASPRNCWAWRKSDNGILCSSDRSCYGHIYQLQLKSGLKNITEIQWPSTSLYNQKSGLLACCRLLFCHVRLLFQSNMDSVLYLTDINHTAWVKMCLPVQYSTISSSA